MISSVILARINDLKASDNISKIGHLLASSLQIGHFSVRFHSFILYLPYIQNFTMQGWNNEIKENVNGEET